MSVNKTVPESEKVPVVVLIVPLAIDAEVPEMEKPVTPLAGSTGGEPASVKFTVRVVPAALTDAEATTGGVVSAAARNDAAEIAHAPPAGK